jgi:hypothetical protein
LSPLKRLAVLTVGCCFGRWGNRGSASGTYAAFVGLIAVLARSAPGQCRACLNIASDRFGRAGNFPYGPVILSRVGAIAAVAERRWRCTRD